IFMIIVKPFIFFTVFMQELLNGSAFDETELIVPDENKNQLLFEECEKNTENIVTMSDSFLCAETVKEDYVERESVIEDEYEEHNEKPSYSLPKLDIFVAEKNMYGDYDIDKELEENARVL